MRLDSDYIFFNDTSTTEIYTLSLHDALPIFHVRRPQPVETVALDLGTERVARPRRVADRLRVEVAGEHEVPAADRKCTRPNSSHANISYPVFCMTKKTMLPASTIVPLYITLT